MLFQMIQKYMIQSIMYYSRIQNNILDFINRIYKKNEYVKKIYNHLYYTFQYVHSKLYTIEIEPMNSYWIRMSIVNENNEDDVYVESYTYKCNYINYKLTT